MKKTIVFVFIRYCLGIVLGIIFVELFSIRPLIIKRLGSDFIWTDWIIIFIVLIMGITTAIWGDKALNKFIDIFFRRKK